MKKGNQIFFDEAKSVAKQALKAKNTALLAHALQPSWDPQTVPAVYAALQAASADVTVPPPGYEGRDEAASFGSACPASQLDRLSSRPVVSGHELAGDNSMRAK